jgi:hypothetical protein
MSEREIGLKWMERWTAWKAGASRVKEWECSV